MLLAVDESLGRILAALERKGILNDTMIVFTSDHGYFYGEHGLNEERRLAYEETIRVPLVIRYPPLTKAGSTPPEMALGLDIAPTLLEVAGLKPGAGLQGRSLVPVLKNEARDWRTSFLIEYFTDTVFPRIRNMGYVAARTSRYKYISYRELQGMDELYDLDTDPYEETNIIDRSDARETLQKMQAELRRLIEETRYAAPAPAVSSGRGRRRKSSQAAHREPHALPASDEGLNAQPHCRELQDRKCSDRTEPSPERNGWSPSGSRAKAKQTGHTDHHRERDFGDGKRSGEDPSHTKEEQPNRAHHQEPEGKERRGGTHAPSGLSRQ